MRILLGYSYYRSPVDVSNWVETWLHRLRLRGFDVHGFPLTLNPPGPALTWPQLDNAWGKCDPDLMSMYERLALAAEDFDVFVNWNGINLHPDFISKLTTFNVFGCFDDPESSDLLSKPVARSYDLCMVGNIAELDSYRSWGVEHVRFWPLGFRADDYDPSLTSRAILDGTRDVNVSLLCERETGWRADRLDKFSIEFPEGRYYGRGWPNGFLSESERVSLYQRTKIGPNFHNSTGPINFRTYILPANGVMQLCDNKSHLAKIFELGKEVVGFDSVEEAIDLCRYYLAHDEERRVIAEAGWRRTLRDYNEYSSFGLIEKYVSEIGLKRKPENKRKAVRYLNSRKRADFMKKPLGCFSKGRGFARSVVRKIWK